MPLETLSEIIQIQSKFLQRLAEHQPPLPHSVPTLLKKIADCDEELLKFTLGSLGQKLHYFATNTDFEHPEIISIFDGALTDDKDFAKECLELLILGRFAKDNKLNRIIPFFTESVIRDFPKNLKKIDIPQNNRMHVRLLKDSQSREEVRMTKKIQTIDLHSLFLKGEQVWDAQPNSFEKFLRFNKVYQEDIAIAEKKAKRYEDMGCSSLALEIRRSIEVFKENMEQVYYGFNRITMTNAAIILAKSLGFNYTNSSIKVDKKFFSNYEFDPDANKLQYSPFISEIAGFPIFNNKETIYDYEPRVYPLHELNSIVPENVKKTISLLEAFPDSGNKPIFDHFGVIVPSINFPVKSEAGYSFLDSKGIVHVLQTREEAAKLFDINLIKNDYICPIIIGEKDNKCYFICYFR